MNNGPSTLTIIPTYRCTAACEQCCFGSNPQLRDRLSRNEIIGAIHQAIESFPSLALVVFSGGECVMLGEDLFAGIATATEANLQTRIVSNGYWGASVNKAKKTARRLRESGLVELNVSTGRDHAQFVSVDAVLNAVSAAVAEGIFGLITVEKDAEDSNIVDTICEDERFKKLAALPESKFRFQINTWMKFNGEHKDRSGGNVSKRQNTPCSQLFANIVVTPHKNISSCCGLTFEHIPEMRIGELNGNGLGAAYAESSKDFMKIWIHTDGPDGVLRKIYDNKPPEGLISNDHMCDTCVRLHKCDDTRELIRQRYHEFAPEVLVRYGIKRIVESKVAQQKHQLTVETI